jgi:hypothetical protein
MGWFPIGYVRLMNDDRKSNLNKSNLKKKNFDKMNDILNGLDFPFPKYRKRRFFLQNYQKIKLKNRFR